MSLTDSQYFSINITLGKEFLKWIHSHRLIDGELGAQIGFGINTPDQQQFAFGGKYGNQFNNIDEVKSFNTAFDKILEKHKISNRHKHSLFYMMTFLKEDYERQSIERNLYNQLLDYSRFLLNLIADSLAHIERVRKNAAYEEVYDIYTQEFFFAKKEVIASMPYEDLLTYIPNVKNADDVVKYLRITLYESEELYVPHDLIFTIQSNSQRKLKTLSGIQADGWELPRQLKYEMFTFMVKNMVGVHKKHNTQFYQDLINDNTILNDLKSIDNKFKKHNVSYVSSLARVGTLVSDYLIMHNLFKSKRSIAQFLFEYFALFKAIPLKHSTTFPDKYEDLIPFYSKNGINGEKIRNMMKDVGGI